MNEGLGQYRGSLRPMRGSMMKAQKTLPADNKEAGFFESKVSHQRIEKEGGDFIV